MTRILGLSACGNDNGSASESPTSSGFRLIGQTGSARSLENTTITYTYDNAGKLLQSIKVSTSPESDPTSSATVRYSTETNSYRYNDLNQRIHLQQATSRSWSVDSVQNTTYTYNASGLLERINTDFSDRGSSATTSTYRYNEHNQVSQVLYLDGTFLSTQSYTYDDQNLLIRLVVDTGFGNSTSTYAYNANNQLTSITGGDRPISTIIYNSAGQITSIESDDASITYTYEAEPCTQFGIPNIGYPYLHFVGDLESYLLYNNAICRNQ